MGMEFYQTRYGQRFFDAQLPALIKGINRLAEAVEKSNELAEKAAGRISNKSLKDKLTQILLTNGFGGLIVSSFEEAKANDRKKNIVLLDDGIYLTFKADLGQEKPVFGEFACWNEDEFEEDPMVYACVANWVADLYDDSDEGLNHRINDEANMLGFTPYDE